MQCWIVTILIQHIGFLKSLSTTQLCPYKVNMLCPSTLVSMGINIHHAIYYDVLSTKMFCGSLFFSSTINTLCMLLRVKKKLLLKNRFYLWSLLDKYNFYAWCPSFKFASEVLGWVRFFTGIALSFPLIAYDLVY